MAMESIDAPEALAPLNAAAQAGLNTYSPGEVLRMIEGQINALTTQFGTFGVLDIVGRLGPVGNTKYNKHYGVELREIGGSIDTLKLDIPTSLKPASMAGKEVKVRGKLEAKKGCEVVLSVFKMRTDEDVSPEALAEEKSIREILRLPNCGSDVFPPALDELHVTTIAAINSQVMADFRNQIEEASQFFRIEAINANFLVGESLIEAIRRASGDIVVILRGGGGDGDFEVFNQPAVLEAWRAKNAYKITAIGHTKNSTLLDRLSHKVADTPTAAGKFLVDRIYEQNDVLVWRRDAKAANEAVAKHADAFQQQIRVMQAEGNQLQTGLRLLEVERETLRGELQRAKESRPVASIPWKLLAAAVAIGVILGWWISRH